MHGALAQEEESIAGLASRHVRVSALMRVCRVIVLAGDGDVIERHALPEPAPSLELISCALGYPQPHALAR